MVATGGSAAPVAPTAADAGFCVWSAVDACTAVLSALLLLLLLMLWRRVALGRSISCERRAVGLAGNAGVALEPLADALDALLPVFPPKFVPAAPLRERSRRAVAGRICTRIWELALAP